MLDGNEKLKRFKCFLKCIDSIITVTVTNKTATNNIYVEAMLSTIYMTCISC